MNRVKPGQTETNQECEGREREKEDLPARFYEEENSTLLHLQLCTFINSSGKRRRKKEGPTWQYLHLSLAEGHLGVWLDTFLKFFWTC
jgi:hypothetical protein